MRRRCVSIRAIGFVAAALRLGRGDTNPSDVIISSRLIRRPIPVLRTYADMLVGLCLCYDKAAVCYGFFVFSTHHCWLANDHADSISASASMMPRRDTHLSP
ncbi:hypothetical protein EV127DRAFT_41554 [Xylaria flabelliformis]|nr:hypothetical protein EV127DRAFT_41554 [Xylaria flabelliformis]